MRVLVTGATGFIGGALARDARQRGMSVTGLGRDLRRGAQLARHGVHFHVHEDGMNLTALIKAHDAVIHCAAQSRRWGPAEAFESANVILSRDLATAAARAGLPFIHMSSASVYSPSPGLLPEEAASVPPTGSAYALSKYLAERAVLRAHPHAVLLRPRAVYGPGDTTLKPRIRRALQTGRLPRLTREELFTDLTHIANLTHAVHLALDTGARGPFNVSDGASVPVWATLTRFAHLHSFPPPTRYVPPGLALRIAGLAERFAALTPDGEPPITREALTLLVNPVTLDLTRARTELGYEPVIRPDDALADLLTPDGTP